MHGLPDGLFLRRDIQRLHDVSGWHLPGSNRRIRVRFVRCGVSVERVRSNELVVVRSMFGGHVRGRCFKLLLDMPRRKLLCGVGRLVHELRCRLFSRRDGCEPMLGLPAGHLPAKHWVV